MSILADLNRYYVPRILLYDAIGDPTLADAILDRIEVAEKRERGLSANPERDTYIH